MNRLTFALWLPLVLSTAVFSATTQTDYSLRLPADVAVLEMASSDDHADISLSANALSYEVTLAAGASIKLINQVCRIRISKSSSQVVAVHPALATSGQLVLELVPVGIVDSSPIRGDNQKPAVPTSPPPAAPPLTPPTVAEMPAIIAKLFSDAGPINFDPVAKSDYAIPASTAATAIGSGDSLVRASAPREVVTSLLSDFDKDGKLLSGFSFAVTPYTLLRSNPLTADEYQKDVGKRFLANLQLSLAGRSDDSVVTGGAKASRYSIGLSMVFFDQGDLRLDKDLLAKIADSLYRRHSDGEITGEVPSTPIPDSQFTAAKKLWDDKKAKKWNAASAGLGVAPAMLSLTGKLSDAKDDGVMVWTSLATPGPGSLADSGQLIFGGNGRFRQRTLKDGIWTRTDALDFGGQFRYGSEAYDFSLQGQYRRRTFANTPVADKFVYEFGFEHRLAQGLWLNLAWTNDDAVTGGKTIRSGLRYGFGDKAVLGLPK
jgi:hypothetical protein